jgi:hypothetical protein
MTIPLIIAVVCMVAGQVCIAIAGFQTMNLNEDVNARLPSEQRIEPIWWGPNNSWKMDRLQKEMFPERWRRNWIISLLGIAFFAIGAGILLFGA